MTTLQLGTRGSQLALFQANMVAALLRAARGRVVRRGCDQDVRRPAGRRAARADRRQAAFVKEIEDALLDGDDRPGRAQQQGHARGTAGRPGPRRGASARGSARRDRAAARAVAVGTTARSTGVAQRPAGRRRSRISEDIVRRARRGAAHRHEQRQADRPADAAVSGRQISRDSRQPGHAASKVRRRRVRRARPCRGGPAAAGPPGAYFGGTCRPMSACPLRDRASSPWKSATRRRCGARPSSSVSTIRRRRRRLPPSVWSCFVSAEDVRCRLARMRPSRATSCR